MVIRIEGLPWPPTMNHRLAPIGRGRIGLSGEYRAYKKYLGKFLEENFTQVDTMINSIEFQKKKLFVQLDYVGSWETWFTKDNRIRKIDVDNRHKAVFDVVFPFLSLDDSQVFDMQVKKIVGNNEKPIVNMTIMRFLEV